METEFRIDHYGIAKEADGNLKLLTEEACDAQGVVFLEGGAILYSKMETAFKLPNAESFLAEDGELSLDAPGKVYAKLSGGGIRVVERDGVAVLFNSGGTIKLLDHAGMKLRYLDERPHAIKAAAFVSASVLAVGGEERRLKVYNIADEKPMFVSGPFTDYIESIACNEKYIVVGTSNGELHAYSHNVPSAHREGEQPPLVLKKLASHSLSHPISSAVFVSATRAFLSLTGSSCLIYDVEMGEIVKRKYCHAKMVTSAKWHDGFLFTSAMDGKVKVFNDRLSLVSHLSLEFPILSFDVSTDEATGHRSYVFSTKGGGLWVYKDSWKREGQAKQGPRKAKRIRTMREYNENSEAPVSSVMRISTARARKRNLYESLVKSFFYKKAFLLSLENDDFHATIAILEYLHKIGRVKQAVVGHGKKTLLHIIEVVVDLLSDGDFLQLSLEIASHLVRHYEHELVACNAETREKLQYLIDTLGEEKEIIEQACTLASFMGSVAAGMC